MGEHNKRAGCLFLASHPPSDERIENLRKRAKETKIKGTPKIGEKKFLENILNHRSEWFLQELKMWRIL